MDVNGIGASASKRPAGTARPAAATPAAEPRALVPVAAIEREERPTFLTGRPAAPFLAQLIATARGEPQTRSHRRAEPATAARAYAAAARLRSI